jgi:hypothetical protein
MSLVWLAKGPQPSSSAGVRLRAASERPSKAKARAEFAVEHRIALDVDRT